MLKKKLLILVDWFIPGYKAGGPIQSTANVAFALKNKYEIFVLTTDTDHGNTRPYQEITPNNWTTDLDPQIKIFYARKSSLSFKQIKEQIRNINADYVYLNHLFSPKFVIYPIWLKYFGIIKNQVIVCPRGALYDSALSIKRYKKKPFLILFKLLNIHKCVTFHATNQREKEAINKYFPGSKIIIADNLPKTIQQPYQSCNKMPGFLKCVFIARIVPIKNLLFLLKALIIVKSKVDLTIIGPLEDEVYWQECQQTIKQLPQNIKATYIGSIENNKLSEILVQNHLFISPTTGENFGHSIFESFLSGRPVLISDQTPWLQLEEQQIGWDLPLNNPELFTKTIEEACNWDQYQFDKWALAAWNYANKFINNPLLYNSYSELFS
jgi:Glycosyltransferase